MTGEFTYVECKCPCGRTHVLALKLTAHEAVDSQRCACGREWWAERAGPEYGESPAVRVRMHEATA